MMNQIRNQAQKLGYLREFEQQLKDLYAKGDERELVTYAKEKLLQSYNNGLSIGAQRAMTPVKSRRKRS